jgi:hypothetical protein
VFVLTPEHPRATGMYARGWITLEGFLLMKGEREEQCAHGIFL